MLENQLWLLPPHELGSAQVSTPNFKAQQDCHKKCRIDRSLSTFQTVLGVHLKPSMHTYCDSHQHIFCLRISYLQVPMNDARYAFTATNLTNGSILVAGGAQLPNTDDSWVSSGLLASCEIYTNGSWTFTGNLTFARAGHQVES